MTISKKSLPFLAVFLFSLTSFAGTGPRHEASGRKSGTYQKEGFFAGGNKEISVTKLKDIRRASNNEGFERIVFDLENPESDVPYFQVLNAEGENRIVVSIWADVQYDFNIAKINSAFAKSKNVKKVTAVPRVEEGLTVFELATASNKHMSFEAFYLTKPNRLIIDIQ